VSIESATSAKAGYAPSLFQQKWPSHKLNKQILYLPARRDGINKPLNTLKTEQNDWLFIVQRKYQSELHIRMLHNGL
jgi:hypothetical protein